MDEEKQVPEEQKPEIETVKVDVSFSEDERITEDNVTEALELDSNEESPKDEVPNEPEQNEVEQAEKSLAEVENTDEQVSDYSANEATHADAPAPLAAATTKRPLYKNKLVLGVFGFVIVAGSSIFAFTAFFGSNGETEVPASQTQAKKMGAAVAVVDGTAESSTDKQVWVKLRADDVISQGQYVRTAESSRVVVQLDDGSAVRINSSSVIGFKNLDVKNVEITNESGEVYTRVVKSDRVFVVTSAGESYTAMGTAYKTSNTATEKGVEVYQSQVALKAANQTVAEGKQYFGQSASTDKANKQSDIPLDKLQKDAFLQWNLDQDKKTTEFNENLGYFKKLQDTVKPVTVPVASATSTPKPGITLSAVKVEKGVKLTWTVTGITVTKGYKVLKSTDVNPTYGEDDGTYVSDSASRTYTWTIKDGKKYNFRVCTYTGDSCTNYSNNASATAPLYASPQPSGSVTLTSVGGKNFTWVLNGSAPNGYKLVWTESGSPVYPGSSAAYQDKTATSGSISDDPGTYNVRICMYVDGGCVNYSNQLTVTVP